GVAGLDGGHDPLPLLGGQVTTLSLRLCRDVTGRGERLGQLLLEPLHECGAHDQFPPMMSSRSYASASTCTDSRTEAGLRLGSSDLAGGGTVAAAGSSSLAGAGLACLLSSSCPQVGQVPAFALIRSVEAFAPSRVGPTSNRSRSRSSYTRSPSRSPHAPSRMS